MAKSTKKQAEGREEERMRKAVRRAAGVKGKAKPKKGKGEVVRLTNTTTPIHKNGLPKGPGKNPCACGCGGTTNSLFQQGHDARVYSTLRKIAQGKAKLASLPEAVRTDKKLLASMKAKVH